MKSKFLYLVGCSLLIGFFASLISCSKQNNSETELSPIERSNRLIDENRDGEAIALLENELKASPTSHDLLVAIAGAYAHRAGFKVQTLIPVLTDLSKTGGKNVPSVPQKNKAPNEAKISMSNFFMKLGYFFSAFDRLPNLSRAERTDIETALTALSTIKPAEFLPGDSVFRALIRLMVLKDKAQSTDEEIPTFLCEDEVEYLHWKIKNLLQVVKSILEDMIFAQPKSKESLTKTWMELLSDYSLLTNNAEVSSIMVGFVEESKIIQINKCGSEVKSKKADHDFKN